MNRLKALSVGKQVLITFGTLCAILLSIGGLFFFSLRTIERDDQRQESRALDKLALIDDTAQDVGQMQAGALREVVASDPGEMKTLDQAVRATEKVNLKELANYREWIETDNEKELYDRVMRARKAYWEQTQQVLAFALENRDAEATKVVISKQAPAYDEYLDATNELIKYVEADAKAAAVATARFISRIRIAGNALAGMAIFIAVGAGFVVASIVGCLKEDNRFLQNEITERKRAEETLRESEGKFRQLADNISDVFWITSPDLKTMHYISAGYELIWGRSMASLYENPHQWIDAILPEERERVFAVFGTLMGDEPKVSVEYRIARPDGAVRWVHDRGFQVRDAAGNLVRLAGLVTDITERKRVEETLRESEERFSGAFEHAPIGVALASPEGRWLKVNRALCEVVGYSEAEMLTRTFADITHPEDLEASLESTRRLLAGETPSYQLEKRYVHARGNLVTILLNVSLVRDGQGEPLYFIAQIQDITRRKEAEREVRFNEKRFRSLVEATTAIVWDTPASGGFEAEQPGWNRLHGTDLRRTSGAGWLSAVHPDDKAKTVQVWVAALAARSIYEVEHRLRARDGTYRNMMVRAVPIQAEDGTILQWIGIHSDITERKRAERQLSIQYAISRVLAESQTLKQASAGILQTVCENLDWDIGEFWNVNRQGAVMQFGDVWMAPDLHADEFITLSRKMKFAPGVGLPGRVWESGKPVWVPDIASDANFPRAAAAEEGGLHGAFSFPILAGSEVVGVIEFFSREIRQPDGELLSMCAVLGSQLGQFFERKRLEERLIESQKMETVGKLAGGVAHEFNSILTAIIGQSEFLLRDLPAGSPLMKSATEISNAADRAATLTRQLLAYGRKQFLAPESLDLNSILMSMEGVVRHLMGGDVDTRIVRFPGLSAVKADAGQIEQVIMNMVINARDAMPNGGKLTFETANVSFEKDTVGRYPELIPGDYVMLAITDTGSGMNPEVKARAFEPFFSTKGVGQGTGLGLSTCYGIIKQSGGHISVYSETGRGTTFKVYLPQVEQGLKTAVPRQGPSVLPRGTETVLLVEDDPSLREMAATLLRQLGYTVFVASNGIEALTLKQQRDIGHIDVVFTDVVMPHMSGKELSERIQALYPRTRILFTSAYTENAITHQGVLNKGVALLPKPFTPSALAHRLREVLDQQDPPALDALQPVTEQKHEPRQS